MHEISESIVIDASPEQVWAVLTNLAAYLRWNPFIIEATGVLEVGQRLRVRMKAPGHRPARFSPTITEVDDERLLEWSGSLGIRGIFDGVHRFELSPSDDGAATTFVQQESFTGLLVRPMAGLLRDTKAGFELMNRALDKRVTRG